MSQDNPKFSEEELKLLCPDYYFEHIYYNTRAAHHFVAQPPIEGLPLDGIFPDLHYTVSYFNFTNETIYVASRNSVVTQLRPRPPLYHVNHPYTGKLVVIRTANGNNQSASMTSDLHLPSKEHEEYIENECQNLIKDRSGLKRTNFTAYGDYYTIYVITANELHELVGDNPMGSYNVNLDANIGFYPSTRHIYDVMNETQTVAGTTKNISPTTLGIFINQNTKVNLRYFTVINGSPYAIPVTQRADLREGVYLIQRGKWDGRVADYDMDAQLQYYPFTEYLALKDADFPLFNNINDAIAYGGHEEEMKRLAEKAKREHEAEIQQWNITKLDLEKEIHQQKVDLAQEKNKYEKIKLDAERQKAEYDQRTREFDEKVKELDRKQKRLEDELAYERKRYEEELNYKEKQAKRDYDNETRRHDRDKSMLSSFVDSLKYIAAGLSTVFSIYLLFSKAGGK